VEIAYRDVDPVVVVTPAGLDQQDAMSRVGAEAAGQQTAGSAGANDDEIEAGIGARGSHMRTIVPTHRAEALNSVAPRVNPRDGDSDGEFIAMIGFVTTLQAAFPFTFGANPDNVCSCLEWRLLFSVIESWPKFNHKVVIQVLGNDFERALSPWEINCM